MVVATWVDKSVTPDVVASDFSKDYVSGAGSSWSLITEAPAKWGLKSQDIGVDMEQAKAALRAGNFVIATGKPNLPFTKGGHFLVLRGIGDDGKIYIGDSGHNDTSTKPWDEATLAGSIKNMWVISK